MRSTWRGLNRPEGFWSSRRVLAALAVLLPGRLYAVTLTFQEGQNGYLGCADTFLSQSAPNTSYGSLQSWEWDSDEPYDSELDTMGLLRFNNIFGNGPGQIPPGSQITSAALTYTVFNPGNAAYFHEALVDWTESVTYNTFGGTVGVQSSEYSELVGSLDAPSTITYVVNVTCSMMGWAVDPASNHGWIILPLGSDGVDVRSSEYTAVIAQRPKLTVVINEGAPAATLVRQPYLQRGSPSSMTLLWRTNVCTDARVRYGPVPGNLNQDVFTGVTDTDHIVTLAGLTPGTRYYYSVGSSVQTFAGGDAHHYFDTSPDPGMAAPFTAWIVGDSGVGGGAQYTVRDAMLAETAGSPPDIYVHVGDMAYYTGTDTEFTNHFFGPYAAILRHTVCWPSLGNHEGDSSNSATGTGPYFESYVLPAGGEAGGVASGTEAYYSFDYANVHFICLDSHESDRTPGSPMLEWLAEDLAATDQEWLIAFWHHPPYSKGTHDSDDIHDSNGSMRDMRENALPLLEAAGVDLVLAGHSHIYERSFLVDGAYDTPTTAAGHIVDPGDGRALGDGAYLKPTGLSANLGAVYVVAGHGGQTLGGTANHPLMFFSELAFGSCLLTVDGNTLSLRNVRADGVISDRFAIVKGAAKGDYNGDAAVDSEDYVYFPNCLSSPDDAPAPSAPATELRCLSVFDADMDGDVDLRDFAAFAAASISRFQ